MARVSIEPLERRHAPALQGLAADARIAATTLVPHPYPEGGALAFAALARAARRERSGFTFAVLADGTVVGSCSLKHPDWATLQAEVGYWIGVPFWGRSYATQAVRLVTAYGVEALGLKRIVAEVLEGNEASGRVLEKLGYRRTQTFPNPHPRHAGTPTYLYVYEPAGASPPGR